MLKIFYIPWKKAALAVIFLVLCISIFAISEKKTFFAGSPLEGKTIVVDAGPGGVDSGANNSYIKEKDVNLDISLYLEKKLSQNGAKVVMTRTQDAELSKSSKIDRSRYLEDLSNRVEIINNADADLFVSIHTNSNVRKPSTRGMIAFYYNSVPQNREIAYALQDVFNTYEFVYDGNSYTSHHIPQKGKYYILVNSKVPGVIVESGFITNSGDLFLLKTKEYRLHIADAVCKGIINYFTKSHAAPLENGLSGIEEENIIRMFEDEEQ